MLARKYRLTTQLVKKVLENGSVYHTEHFSLRIVQASLPALTHLRVAVIVSKKQGTTAVIRNRNRRRISSAVAPLITRKLEQFTPALVAIFLKKNIDTCTIVQIRGELQIALEKTLRVA